MPGAADMLAGMRWLAIAILLALGCSTPPDPFCVGTSLEAFCGDDARGNAYEAVCPAGSADAGPSGTIRGTCTRGVLDPCPDGSEVRCVPAR